MKPVMKVTVVPTQFGRQTFEGRVELPSLLTTKLRKEDGCTRYTTVSNLRQAAVAAARKYNATLNFVTPKKMAAKKSAR